MQPRTWPLEIQPGHHKPAGDKRCRLEPSLEPTTSFGVVVVEQAGRGYAHSLPSKPPPLKAEEPCLQLMSYLPKCSSARLHRCELRLYHGQATNQCITFAAMTRTTYGNCWQSGPCQRRDSQLRSNRTMLACLAQRASLLGTGASQER